MLLGKWVAKLSQLRELLWVPLKKIFARTTTTLFYISRIRLRTWIFLLPASYEQELVEWKSASCYYLLRTTPKPFHMKASLLSCSRPQKCQCLFHREGRLLLVRGWDRRNCGRMHRWWLDWCRTCRLCLCCPYHWWDPWSRDITYFLVDLSSGKATRLILDKCDI